MTAHSLPKNARQTRPPLRDQDLLVEPSDSPVTRQRYAAAMGTPVGEEWRACAAQRRLEESLGYQPKGLETLTRVEAERALEFLAHHSVWRRTVQRVTKIVER